MDDSSNPEPTSPVPTVRYGRIWLFNILVTGLALFLFMVTDATTRELIDVDGLIFLAIPTVIGTGLIAAAGTIVSISSVYVLQRLKRSPRTYWLWLGVPAWVFGLSIAVYALWGLTPQQRLKKVCWGAVVPARNIRVAGCTGMQMSEWLAVFEIHPGDFQKLVEQQQLQPDSAENFAAKLNRVALVKRSALYASLPTTTKAQCYKREVTGVDGHVHGGIYAAYDVKTARAVVFHDGY